jgi:hypothetical protein
VFGDRSAGFQATADRILFRTLFSGSLLSLGLVGVAFILDAAALDRPTSWRVCSLIHAACLLASTVSSIALSRRGGERFFRWHRGGQVVFVVGVGTLGLSIANVVILHSFWPLLAVIWWGLAVSLWAFVALLFSARAA